MNLFKPKPVPKLAPEYKLISTKYVKGLMVFVYWTVIDGKNVFLYDATNLWPKKKAS